VLAHVYSDATGRYSFAGLADGDYVVSETDPEEFASTTPNLVRLAWVATAPLRQDFGDTRLLPGCFHAIGGLIWHDGNANNIRDADEEPLPDVAVRVLDLTHNLVALTLSNASGAYSLRGLDPARYYVIIDPPAATSCSLSPLHWGIDLRGCTPATILVGLQAESESGCGTPAAPAARGVPDTLRVPIGDGNSIVSGTVWNVLAVGNDSVLNRRALPGVRIVLRDGAGHTSEQRTDAAGSYRFEGLRAEPYYLTQEPLEGYEPLLTRYWGVAATTACEILIDLENRPTPSAPTSRYYIPLVTKN
jgi:hypothetical protein